MPIHSPTFFSFDFSFTLMINNHFRSVKRIFSIATIAAPDAACYWYQLCGTLSGSIRQTRSPVSDPKIAPWYQLTAIIVKQIAAALAIEIFVLAKVKNTIRIQRSWRKRMRQLADKRTSSWQSCQTNGNKANMNKAKEVISQRKMRKWKPFVISRAPVSKNTKRSSIWHQIKRKTW